MICKNCGATIKRDALFCGSCGMPQEKLIKLVISGDQHAFELLYNYSYQSVYWTIHAMADLDEDTIDDIMQNSYLKAYRALPQLNEPTKFNGWIKRIAQNETLDYLRKDDKNKTVFLSDMVSDESDVDEYEIKDETVEANPEASMEYQDQSRILNEVLDEIPEEQRVVLSMYYMQQMSVKEIAEELGISESTVKSRMSYGRKKVEKSVLELEKKGVSLLGLTAMGFFTWLITGISSEAAAAPASAAVLLGIQQAIMGAASSSASVSGSFTAVKTVKKASSIVKTTTIEAGKRITTTVTKIGTTRVLTGVLTLAVVGSGTGAIIHNAQNGNSSSKVYEQGVACYQEGNYEKAQEYFDTLPEDADEDCVKNMPGEMQEAYNEIVKTFVDEGNSDYPRGNANVWDYYFTDIDKNGLAELVVQYGVAESDVQAYVYTWENDQPEEVGSFYCSYASFYYDPRGNGMVMTQDRQGVEDISTIEMEDNDVKVTNWTGHRREIAQINPIYLRLPYKLEYHSYWNDNLVQHYDYEDEEYESETEETDMDATEDLISKEETETLTEDETKSYGTKTEIKTTEEVQETEIDTDAALSKSAHPVATIGDESYRSLKAAAEAVKDGETIILHRNVSLDSDISFENGINFTIDLNGCEIKDFRDPISNDSKMHRIYIREGSVNIQNGNLGVPVYISDNACAVLSLFEGEEENPPQIVVDEGGTLTIESGSFFSMKNGGTVTVKSGTFGDGINNLQSGVLTIENATVTAVEDEVVGSSCLSNSGTMTVKDGDFSCSSANVIWNSGIMEISGGTFTQTSTDLNLRNILYNDDGFVNITGGTFTFPEGGYHCSGFSICGGDLTMSGGTIQVGAADALYVGFEGKFEMSGGSLEAYGQYHRALYIDGDSDGNAIITGGTIYSERWHAIYATISGHLDVQGGNILTGNSEIDPIVTMFD